MSRCIFYYVLVFIIFSRPGTQSQTCETNMPTICNYMEMLWHLSHHFHSDWIWCAYDFHMLGHQTQAQASIFILYLRFCSQSCIWSSYLCAFLVWGAVPYCNICIGSCLILRTLTILILWIRHVANSFCINESQQDLDQHSQTFDKDDLLFFTFQYFPEIIKFFSFLRLLLHSCNISEQAQVDQEILEL